MPVYTVTMTHPDGDAWGLHVREHVNYLLSLIKQGRLLASGPLKDTKLRAGFLLIRAESREEVERVIANDPVAKQDLIRDLNINEWDPLFGSLKEYSSASKKIRSHL